MLDEHSEFEEIDIERHMHDNASRIEMISFAQNKYSVMQKLLLKAQRLSDKDFETAYASFESIIESFNKKVQKAPESNKPEKNKLSKLIT